MRGRVEPDNTCFGYRLHRLLTQAQPKQEVALVGRLLYFVTDLMRKARVLIVDDDREVTELVSEWLRGEYAVFTATTGEEALGIARRIDPHVVLLDVVMPHPNGFEIAAELRRHPRSSCTHLIFVTGLQHPEHALRALELGALDFLYKPLDEDTVRSRVRTALELRKSAG